MPSNDNGRSEWQLLVDIQLLGLNPPGPLTDIGSQLWRHWLCALLTDTRKASIDHHWSTRFSVHLLSRPENSSSLCGVNFPPMWNLASWSTLPDRAGQKFHSSFPIFLILSCGPGTSKPIDQWIVAFHTPRQADSYKELLHPTHNTNQDLVRELYGSSWKMRMSWYRQVTN